jgi:acetyl esterase/lipase
MHNALKAKGIESRLITIENGPHGFDFMQKNEPAVIKAFDDVVMFLKGKLIINDTPVSDRKH